MKKTINIIILLLLVSLFLFTPLAGFKKIIIIGVLLLLWVVSSLGINNKAIRETVPLLIVLIIMLIIQFVYSFFPRNGDEFRRFYTNFILTYFWGIFGVYYASNLDLFKKSIPFIALMIAISCIYTISGNLIIPNASRMLAGAEDESSQMYELMISMHIGGYDFIYALVFALFPSVLWFKSRVSRPLLSLLFIVLICGTLIVGSYFTSIVLAISIIALSISSTKKFSTFIMVFGSFLVLLLIFKDILLQWLFDFGVAIDSPILQMRAQEMLEGSYQEEADAIGQYSRLDRAFNAFHNILQSPIFGRMTFSSLDIKPSGHSDFLGYFERYGVFGSLYIYYYYLIYKNIIGKAVSNETKRMIKALFVFLFIFLCLDTFDIANATGCMVFLIAPCAILYIETLVSTKNMDD